MSRTRKPRLGVILLIIVILYFGITTVIQLAANGWSFNGDNINTEKISDTKNVTNINIDVSSTGVNVIQEDREDVKVTLTGQINPFPGIMKPKLVLDKSGNNLNISVKTSKVFLGFISMSGKLNLYIPKNYSQDLTINASSGAINLDEPLKLNNLSCSVSSGGLKIKDVTCNKFTYEGSSGSLKVDTLNAKEAAFDSSSGNITIDNFIGNISGESSSGNIHIIYKEFNNNVKLEASSGNINLKLPKSAEFYLDATSSSSDVECDFPITVTEKQKDNSLKGTVKSDKNKVILDTSSGNINISY